PVSRVNSPIVPVVASSGVNLGAGLNSSSALTLLLGARCAGRAVAGAESGGLFSSAFSMLEEGVESEVTIDVAWSDLLGLLVLLGKFLEKTAGTSSKFKSRRSPRCRMINRIMK